MTAKNIAGVIGALLQLLPLALLAFYLFVMSKPIDGGGHPGLAFYRPPGLWYVFPFSMALGLAGVFAITSRTAANAAALLASVAFAYAVRLVVAADTTDAVIIGILAAASIVGWTLRTLSWRATNDIPAGDIWARFGIVLQVAPLFLVVLLLVIVSGFSIPSGRPGVSAGNSPEWFLLACGIGLFAFATTLSRTAATICAVLTCGALVLAVSIAQGGNGGFGIMLGTAAALSLLGWMLRQTDRTVDKRQVVVPS